MSWLAGTRTRLRLLFARRDAEHRMEEEFAFHLAMEAERLEREHGLDAAQARRQALIAFGRPDRHRDALRDGRGLAWLGGLTLDLKLGVRMLAKYPVLTVVGGLAMSFAVWVGVVTFHVVSLFLNPTLPLPGGDRVVQIRTWDLQANVAEPRALHDFLVWQRAARSLTDLGAWRDVTRNLIAADGDARPVEVAEITAAAFRIAPDRPLLGRVLVADDERADAPPVVVLGHEVWRTRFASDPKIVGRTVQLGETYATVVGVMPAGFQFPVAHDLWTPLRPALLDVGPREGPGITVFGRLAPGVTLDAAQAELGALGRRAATESPDTHEHLQAQVKPYATLAYDPTLQDRGAMLSIHGFAILLLALVCGNVALLLFARAATRESEIVVRTALGASRGRIVVQMFAEALVLGGLSTIVGLAAASFALRQWGLSYLERNLGRLPFWYDVHLTPTTVLYAGVLTVLASLIAGVMPALKVTRALGPQLRRGTAGGGGVSFGGVWTAVIVCQVAVMVAFPVAAYVERRELVRIRSYDIGFPAHEYLGVQLDTDAAVAPRAGADSAAVAAARQARLTASLAALRERVAAQPGVAGVTFIDRLPRMLHRERRVELDDVATTATTATDRARGASAPADHEVSLASVDPSYFDVMGAPVRAGRGFRAVDLAPDARVVVVDQGFVDEVLHGQNPIGRRIRFAARRAAPGRAPAVAEERPWYEIVGVVKELGMGYPTHHHRAAGVYMPAAPGSYGALHMVVLARGAPMELAPRLRTTAAAVDPTLRLSEFQRLDGVANDILWVLGVWLRVTLVLSAIAVLLSLAGIYAVLSFTVARRTREIGVRVALGASRLRVVAEVFRRPLTQVGVGVAAGGVLVAGVAMQLTGGGLAPAQLALLGGYVVLMLGVCLLACVVPTQRALGVEPTVALREE